MEPTLDTWPSIFLLAVAMGLFLFVVLITGRSKRNTPIAFLVLVFSIILFQYVLYWTKYDQVYPYLNLFPPFCYYLTGPLLYCYILTLYNKEVHFNYSVHYLPAFLVLVPNLVLWLKYAGVMTIDIPFMFLAQGHWLIATHMAIYTLLIIRVLYQNSIKKNEFTKVRGRWAKVLTGLYSLFIFSYVSYYVLVNFSFFSAQWDYMISVVMSISIYTIGFFSIKEPLIFDGEFFSNLFLPIKNKNESFENSLLNEFYEYLENYMVKEKPFIDNELRLVNLADKVGFSTHLLSKIINEKSGKNFNTFINEYRLQEAEQMLLSDENQNIKSIYFAVGFNNKVTFYKTFKNKYNCTPSEYKSLYSQGKVSS